MHSTIGSSSQMETVVFKRMGSLGASCEFGAGHEQCDEDELSHPQNDGCHLPAAPEVLNPFHSSRSPSTLLSHDPDAHALHRARLIPVSPAPESAPEAERDAPYECGTAQNKRATRDEEACEDDELAEVRVVGLAQERSAGGSPDERCDGDEDIYGPCRRGDC